MLFVCPNILGADVSAKKGSRNWAGVCLSVCSSVKTFVSLSSHQFVFYTKKKKEMFLKFILFHSRNI